MAYVTKIHGTGSLISRAICAARFTAAETGWVDSLLEEPDVLDAPEFIPAGSARVAGRANGRNVPTTSTINRD